MAIPAELNPLTFWEERAALMEDAVMVAMEIIATHLPPYGGAALNEHLVEWNKLMGEVIQKHTEANNG